MDLCVSISKHFAFLDAEYCVENSLDNSINLGEHTRSLEVTGPSGDLEATVNISKFEWIKYILEKLTAWRSLYQLFVWLFVLNMINKTNRPPLISKFWAIWGGWIRMGFWLKILRISDRPPYFEADLARRGGRLVLFILIEYFFTGIFVSESPNKSCKKRKVHNQRSYY